MKASDSDVARLVTSFDEYAKTGDPSAVEQYSLELLKHVLVRNSHARGRPYYVAIESRVASLKEKNDETAARRSRRTDIVIGAIVGILTTLIAQWIWSVWTGSK